MDIDRYKHLMNDESEPLTDDELRLGWHFCYEFDGLLEGPGVLGWDQRIGLCICGHRLEHVEDDIEFRNEISRKIDEHEVFLSFNSDWMAELFTDWFVDIGRDSLLKYADEHEGRYEQH